jgi:hypothetical protein
MVNVSAPQLPHGERRNDVVPDAPALPVIRPVTFCTPEAALGTYGRRVDMCAKTRTSGEPYSDGRAQWRQQ